MKPLCDVCSGTNHKIEGVQCVTESGGHWNSLERLQVLCCTPTPALPCRSGLVGVISSTAVTAVGPQLTIPAAALSFMTAMDTGERVNPPKL